MSIKPDTISMSVIKRLPRYYRFLGNLKKNGIVRVSSKELSAKMGFTASQIRQDLNCFGGFGQQGYGYNVEQLYNEIGVILGVNSGNKTIIIGMGNLGKAMASHIKFAKSGFNIIGLFDSDDRLTGEVVNGMQISNMSDLGDFCKEHSPTVAVLCVPESAAENIVSDLVSFGVNNFWNFSHYDIVANFPGTISENVHLNDSLMTLSYQMMHKSEE